MKKAFTLAEVLITLGIIGIVAALTIPTLMQKHNDAVIVNRFKKTYSALQNAYEMMQAEYGMADKWDLRGHAAQENELIDRFAKYLKYQQKCYVGDASCVPNVTYKKANGDDAENWSTEAVVANRSSMILADGQFFMLNVRVDGTKCPSEETDAEKCKPLSDMPLQFYVDINGEKGPNKKGEDFFYIFADGESGKLIPGGWKKTVESKQLNFVIDCINGNGANCANWIIENGNVDYLHCSDLSYDGKTKCN
ncbi:type II secretion system protein [bacterium]|nr:type II secretion system protein [bacterium]